MFSFDKLCEKKNNENILEYWTTLQAKVREIRVLKSMNEVAEPQVPEATKAQEIQSPKTAKTEASKSPPKYFDYMVDDENSAHRARYLLPKKFIPGKKVTTPTPKKDFEEISTTNTTLESQKKLGPAETVVQTSPIPVTVTSKAPKPAFFETFEDPLMRVPKGVTLEKEKVNVFKTDIFKFVGKGFETPEKRSKRDTMDSKFDVLNETGYFDIFRCEEGDGTIFTSVNPFSDEKNEYQQMLAWRFWGLLLLCIHLALVLYHLIYNIFHHSPSSKCLNNVFISIGFVVWNSISLWITYQYFMWNRTFDQLVSPTIPSFPSEFCAFWMLTVTMDAVLLFELFTPLTYSVSYEVNPRHPSLEYIPVATDGDNNNNNNNGTIRTVESAPQSPAQSSPAGSLNRSK